MIGRRPSVGLLGGLRAGRRDAPLRADLISTRGGPHGTSPSPLCRWTTSLQLENHTPFMLFGQLELDKHV